MYIKNLTQNHISLFHGGLVVKRGATELIAKADADSREVSDAVRRGWIALVNDAEGGTVAATEIAPPTMTDPATVGTLDPSEVAAEAAASATSVKRTRKAKADTEPEASSDAAA